MKISLRNGDRVEKERPSEEQRRVRIICLALAAVTFCLYARTLGHEFVNYDDHTYIVDNTAIQNGFTPRAIAWAFTANYAGNWHPLTWISHLVDYQLYGVKNPGGHHFTNVLFHIANTLLLFVWLRSMTGAVWRSAMVAALFAWHPLHVESVAWIAERKDVLSGFFWLLTMLAYVKYVTEQKANGPKAKQFYYLTLGLFGLGLLSKPMVVTLPCALLLLDYWPLRRVEAGDFKSWMRLLLEKAPFFLLVMISSIATFMAQKKGGAVMALGTYPLDERFANTLVSYARYLRKIFWPVDLAVFYPFVHAWPVWVWVGSGTLILVVTMAAIFCARRQPYFPVGWFWYLGMLVPVIGLVQVGIQSLADRYTYLPSIGIFTVLVWGVGALTARWPRPEPILITMATLVLGACLALTANQLTYWQNTETLFTHDLAVTTNNVTAHDNLGLAMENKGNSNAAMEHYQIALSLESNSPITLYLIGLHYAHQGDYEKAVGYYTNAMNYDPGSATVRYNLGNALAELGRLDEAILQYSQALAQEPDGPDIHNNLGAVLFRKGRLPDAEAEFKTALRLKPNFPEALDQMGTVMRKVNHPELAQIYYEEALRLKPDFTHAELKLGLVLAEQGYLQQAIPHFLAVIKAESKNVEAYFDLGGAYNSLRHFDLAAQTFAELIRFKPDSPEAHLRLGSAVANQGKMEAAMEEYREALHLKPDMHEAMRGLAWILATDAKPELRNGPEAVRLAERANELTGGKQAVVLSALDAAYAECGRFDEAIKTAEQAQKLATASNQKALAEQAAKRLELYRAGKPFHG